MSRTTNTVKNSLTNSIIHVITIAASFIARTVFIHVLGETYLGLNGLFSNILSLLSLADLGVTTAIGYSLYDPIAKKDTTRIRALMGFYKKSFYIIGGIFFVVGLLIMLALPLISSEIANGEIPHVYLIFLIYLLNGATGYYLTYRIILIESDQKKHKLFPINFAFALLVPTIQIIALLITRDIIYYALALFLCNFLHRAIINLKIRKEYPFTKDPNPPAISTEDKKTLKSNVSALMYHRIGEIAINSTDSVIISAMLNLAIVGIYSNYILIITSISGLIGIFFASIIPSFGDLIVEKTKHQGQKISRTFETIDFANFWLHTVLSICIILLISSFINIWVGPDYILPMFTTILIVISFYISGMRYSLSTVHSAAGLYALDRLSPVIQTIINIIASIILTYFIGLPGIILGTIISFIIPTIWRAIIVYRHAFNQSSAKYFITYILRFSFTAILAYITYLLFSGMPDSTILSWCLKALACFTFVNLIIITVFWRSTPFRHLMSILTKNKLKP